MRIVEVTSHCDITRLSAAVTLAALVIVTGVTVLLYPREAWLWEILVAWPTTVLIAYGATRIVGRQMLRIHTLNQELQRLVSRDRLTNLATRDFFFDRLADSPDTHGVSLMVDIDHFKAVNDAHGHLTGDAVIREVARILVAEVGARDIVCRFGGEEFVVFLENATRAIAAEVSERICRRVATASVPGVDHGVSVSVSIGGSPRHAAAEIEDAIRQADAALYRAKALGRNRVVMYADLPDGDRAAAGHGTAVRSAPRAAG